jgi:hypothetical protein
MTESSRITETIAAVDNALHNEVKHDVPADISGGETGGQQQSYDGVFAPPRPINYEDRTIAPLTKKVEASKLLTGETPRIEVSVPASDSEIIENKRRVWKKYIFDKWFLGYLLEKIPSDQIRQKYLREIYPELIDDMVKASDSLHDLQREYFMIKLRGAKSLKELAFLQWYDLYGRSMEYSAQKLAREGVFGLVKIEDFGGKDKMEQIQKETFQRGLFSVPKRVSDALVGIRHQQRELESLVPDEQRVGGILKENAFTGHEGTMYNTRDVGHMGSDTSTYGYSPFRRPAAYGPRAQDFNITKEEKQLIIKKE